MSHIAAVRASRAGCIAGEGENEFKSILLTTPTRALFFGDLILFLDCYRLHAVQMDSRFNVEQSHHNLYSCSRIRFYTLPKNDNCVWLYVMKLNLSRIISCDTVECPNL